jgi:fibronectin type 3 domain-containing protein
MADGVTWVKVSPGGKLSNISGDFSPWDDPIPPHWTAFRDNTMHHFLHVRVAASGTLRVEAIGVTGDGSPPIVQDSFEYTTGSCPEPPPGDTVPPDAPTGLAAAGSSTGIDLNWDDNPAVDLAGYHVYRAGSAAGPFARITTSLVGASVYTDFAAPTGTTSYYYVTAVDASGNESAPSATANASRPAGTTYQLLLSTAANRTSPVALDGQTVVGNIYVFTAPDTPEISRVRFWLDNPSQSGAPRRTENNAPYDFNGGTVSAATPFDTRSLSDGTHTISAAIDFSNGSTQTVHATFVVANSGPVDTTAPAAPTNLTALAAADGSSIELDWDDNQETDLAGYHVYRSSQIDGPYTRISPASGVGGSAHSDGSAPSGVTSYYVVTAVDMSGNESEVSNIDSAERPVDTTAPSAPTGLTATATTSGITLDWNDNSAPDLAGYFVYRGASATGSFARLTATPVVGSAYVDGSAPTGATSYYYVTAVDASGNESVPSAIANASRPAETTYQLLVSSAANRASPIPLDGQTVVGNIYIFTAPDTPGISRVRFWLDNPTLSGNPWRTENNAPYDFNGGTVSTAKPFETRSLTDGMHTISATIEFADGTRTVISASFTVANVAGTSDLRLTR